MKLFDQVCDKKYQILILKHKLNTNTYVLSALFICIKSEYINAWIYVEMKESSIYHEG